MLLLSFPLFFDHPEEKLSSFSVGNLNIERSPISLGGGGDSGWNFGDDRDESNYF
jgi:hypothetical protein